MNHKLFVTIFLLSGTLFLLSSWRTQTAADRPLTKLSDYELFVGAIADLQPATDVLPYELNSPLFSDYAYKKRFIRLPKGMTVSYNPNEVLNFPVGTVIAKTFYYPADMRQPDQNHNLLETRILIHQETGWKALPYVWNDEQTEAYLDVAGGNKSVQWRDERGKKRKLEYSIPNLNQCKGCHYRDGQDILPIGPSARQLNNEFAYTAGTKNQLTKWVEKEWLTDLPALTEVPKMADWRDPTSGTLAERARGYLDANCAHCHNAKGPANTSGLFLNVHETDPASYGVNKAPIAAGRGSGDRPYSIVKGDPDQSILVYRMASDDPGVMMPEVSRKMVHTEGVALIREWIASL